MNTNLTDLTVILDRSGSMQSIRHAMEPALDALIEQQRQQTGDLVVSLVRFDSEVEPVFTALNASKVRRIRIQPRHSTALLDAIGDTIDRTGERLSAMTEADRPGAIMVVIVTDGMENASQRFSWSDVQRRIEHQRDAYNWQFSFLGTNIDAVATASKIGIGRGDALDFAGDSDGVVHAAMSLSRGLSRQRVALFSAEPGPLPSTFEESDRDRQARRTQR